MDLLTACTWAFLVGLVGDTWLEVAVRSYYANQDTRTPLVAAFVQAIAFVLLSMVLTPIIGLAGIPLSAAITFSMQGIVLLALLNRRFPGLLNMGSTAIRAALAAAAGGAVALGATLLLPISPFFAAIVALFAGTLVALPLIRAELGMLFHL
jgi:putative peptidoglycan lipid II flippase